VGSAYGSAGSLVVILLWVYYSSQLVLFGAEFTAVYADRYGSRVRPKPDAEAVSEPAVSHARAGR
jgi:membrane protein